MKRTMTLIAVISYIMTIILLNNSMLLVIPLIIIGFYFTQTKYRFIYIILVGCLLISIQLKINDYNSYDQLKDHIEDIAEITTYGVDYKMTLTSGHKILVKNDVEEVLRRGTYQVRYKKTVFFYQNPNMFNYKHYLNSRNLSDVVNLSELVVKPVELKNRQQTDLLKKFKEKLKRTDYYSYYMALLFNDKSLIDKKAYEKFMLNGTGHVLAISGLHIGLLFGCFYSLFKIINKKFARTIGFALISLYVVYINIPLSALRALMMIGLSFIALYNNRKYDLLQTMGLIGYVMILTNPYIIYNAGFQYSFASVLIIEVCYQTFFRHIKSIWLQLLLLPLVIQMGLMPLTLYHNNSVHLLSFIANIPTVLLITIVLNCLLIAMFVPGMLILDWTDHVFKILLQINNWLYDLDLFIFKWSSPPFVFVVVFYMLLFLVHEKRYKKHLIVVTISILIMWLSYFTLVTEVYFLDVGQGDCILIKRGFHTILIDGGFESDEDHLEEILLKQGINSIDYLILSHSHMDHIGGFVDIKDMTTDSILFYKQPNQKEDIFKEVVYRSKYAVDELKSVDLGWCQLDFIDYEAQNSLNDSSLIMEITLYGTKFLFTGDIEERVESQLINKLSDVDIVKVPHHGSRTSSTLPFIAQISPEIAVVSVGKNSYGHPNKNVLERYLSQNSEVHLTVDGCVKIIVLPFSNYFVKPWN